MAVTYQEAGPARLLRCVDGRWEPVGPVLPPVEDDGLHEPTLRPGQVIHWHFPASIDARPGDRLLVRERAVELLDRCGPTNWAVRELAAYMHAHYDDHEWVDRWLADRQVWSARVLERLA